jgi:hypothetical protein
MLFALDLSNLTSFFTFVFPFSLSSTIGIILLMVAFLLTMFLPMQVGFPKAALTEAA